MVKFACVVFELCGQTDKQTYSSQSFETIEPMEYEGNRFDSIAVLAAAHSSARLQVRSYSLAGAFMKLDKLAIARLQDRLHLLLGLLRYRHHTIQVLVDEQPHKQLKEQAN